MSRVAKDPDQICHRAEKSKTNGQGYPPLKGRQGHFMDLETCTRTVEVVQEDGRTAVAPSGQRQYGPWPVPRVRCVQKTWYRVTEGFERKLCEPWRCLPA